MKIVVEALPIGTKIKVLRETHNHGYDVGEILEIKSIGTVGHLVFYEMDKYPHYELTHSEFEVIGD